MQKLKSCDGRFVPVYSIAMTVVGASLFVISRALSDTRTALLVSNAGVIVLLIAALTTLCIDRRVATDESPELGDENIVDTSVTP